MVLRIFVIVITVGCFASAVSAEELGVSFSPAALPLVGVFAVNTGVAIANGVTLAVDNPSWTNGRFGWYSGLATAALGGVLYLASLGDEDSGGAALFLAGSGAASAAVGAWTMWAAEQKDGGVRMSSMVVPRPDGASVMMFIDF